MQTISLDCVIELTVTLDSSQNNLQNTMDGFPGFHTWGYPFIAGWFLLGKISGPLDPVNFPTRLRLHLRSMDPIGANQL